MLASAARLRRRSDFAAAVRAGRRAGSGRLVVHLATPSTGHTPDLVDIAGGQGATPDAAGDLSSMPARASETTAAATGVRAGFVVPRTVGGAVVRNKVRRRLRHLVRERLTDLPAGSSLVVRALPGAESRDYAQLGADLDTALRAARQPRGRKRHR